MNSMSLRSNPFHFRGLQFLILLCVCFLQNSCAAPNKMLAHRNSIYLGARSIPPLRVPPGIASSTIKNYYPVPYYPQAVQPISIIPPGLEQR